MSRLQVFADLSTQRLTNADGAPIALPTQVLGDTLLLELRLLDRVDDGELREVDLAVRSLRASIGPVMAPPASGTFSLRIIGPGATVTTPALSFDADAATLQSALSASFVAAGLTLAATTAPTPGCWLLSISGGTPPIDIEAVTNLLTPTCFVRVTPFEVRAGEWLHEIRLIQTPYAFTGGHERVLPDAPRILQIREGRGATPSEPAINELQGIVIPPAFRGTYLLRFMGRETRPFSTSDGPAEVTEALNELYLDGRRRFAVTQGELDTGYVEFVGDLAGAPQPDLEAEVVTHPPGVISFALALDRAAMHAALRAQAQVRVPFELELEVVDEETDIDDPGVSGRRYTLAQVEVLIVREQIWDGLDAVPTTDYLRPPRPVSYQPPTTNQVLIGAQLTHRTLRGDGTLRVFDIDHTLASQDITSVTVLDAAGNAKVHGLDYDWRVMNADTVRVSVAAGEATPALNAWTILVKAPGPLNAYQAHTHGMSEIVGLLAWKSTTDARLSYIEGLLPAAPPARVISGTSTGFTQALPPRRRFFPGRFPTTFNQASDNLTDALLRRPPALLPALHVASVTTFSGALPGSPTAGVVYQNTGARLAVPGHGGRPRSWLEQNGFVAWDSRGFWYRLTRDVTPSATTSYFPTDCEQELWALAFNARRLRAGQRLTIRGTLDLATFAATTSVQCLLVVRLGTVSAQASPSTTGENLENVVWNVAQPLLQQRVVMTGIATPPHEWAVEIVRNSDGSFATSQGLYGAWEAGGAIPASPDFAVGMSLVQWDTENAASTSATNAKGFLFYHLREATVSII